MAIYSKIQFGKMLHRRTTHIVVALGCIVLVLALNMFAQPGRGVTAVQVIGALVLGTTLAMTYIAMGRLIKKLATLRRHHLLAHLFDTYPSCVAAVTPSGTVTYANLQYQKYFEAPQPRSLIDALARITNDPAGIMDRFHKYCDAMDHKSELLRNGPLTLLVTVQRTKDGNYLWQLCDSAPMAASVPGLPELPAISFGPGGTVLALNESYKAKFGDTPRTLGGISTGLCPGRDGNITLFPTTGPETFVARYVMEPDGRGVLFLMPSSQMSDDALDAVDIFEFVPVPMMKVDLNGTILGINSNARALLRHGVSAGQYMQDVFVATTRSMSEWLEYADDPDRPMQPEFLRLVGKGDELILQASLTRFGEEQENIFICTLNDVTELKSLEAQFVQSQKMQAIGQLAGGVAHDFNNLLTAISGHCDLLLLRHDQTDADYPDLMQIHQNANRAASLVGQLLAFSRKQKLEFQSLNMRDTLADLAHLLNRLVGEKIQLVLDHGEELDPVRCDKRQLEQVLMNLVVNARDAMPDGGSVTITTQAMMFERPEERGKVIVPPGSYVLVSVADEGVGIQPDRQDKVFEPFYTTKKTGEGTGLGLSTVYGIVQQSGGYIFLESELDKGTRFDVLLPAAPVPAQEDVIEIPVIKEAASPALRAEGIILLVEDEAPVRAFASRALQLKGFTVLEADCGEAALELLEDPDLHVDVFVTDVIMPGMDGPSWVAQARENRPDVAVVFVSGYAEDSFADRQEEFESAAFLAKPFSLSDLTKTVQAVLG